MKKIAYIFLATLFLLSGCIGTSVEKADILPGDKSLPIVEKVPTENLPSHLLKIEATQLQFISGWLSENEITYVVSESNLYRLKSFNILTEEIKTLVEEEERITEVIIHPSKETILLHTGNDPTSATVKIIKPDGSLQNEITIDSTELSIEWNESNPDLLMLTAFHEDWSFDLFLYERKESELSLLPIDDPFPTWIGPNEIVFGKEDKQLEEGHQLSIYNPVTGIFSSKNLVDENYMGIHKNRLLTMEFTGEDMHFVIRNLNGQPISEWILPELPERKVPQVEWISADELIIYSPDSTVTEKHGNFIHIKNGGETINYFDVKMNSVMCSPSGNVCIVGENAESLIWMATGEQKNWLDIIN